ncbi:hypothetical protein DL93DRAFT_833035 [Clavulina sp. PMI_390]|nr:hypothetical protein DL93DRAFT_833035 [Clavulina sp. PMI_390]
MDVTSELWGGSVNSNDATTISNRGDLHLLTIMPAYSSAVSFRAPFSYKFDILRKRSDGSHLTLSYDNLRTLVASGVIAPPVSLQASFSSSEVLPPLACSPVSSRPLPVQSIGVEAAIEHSTQPPISTHQQQLTPVAPSPFILKVPTPPTAFESGIQILLADNATINPTRAHQLPTTPPMPPVMFSSAAYSNQGVLSTRMPGYVERTTTRLTNKFPIIRSQSGLHTSPFSAAAPMAEMDGYGLDGDTLSFIAWTFSKWTLVVSVSVLFWSSLAALLVVSGYWFRGQP